MKTEIEDLAELSRFLADPQRDWSQAVLQGLDLSAQPTEQALRAETPTGVVVIGCVSSPSLSAHFARHGAFIVPPAPTSTGFDPFRGALYDAITLVDGFDVANGETSYRDSYDWKAYLASMDLATKLPRTDLAADAIMLQRLHDFSMEDALDEFLRPSAGPALKVVAIMGGHDMPRAEKSGVTDSDYMRTALLARNLALAGFTVATGGGPGAMEAGNLGAWFAGRSENDLRAAVRVLASVPKIQPIPGSNLWNSGEWMTPAFQVRATYPIVALPSGTHQSIGIPTWFYGHEPPNPFATHIAKYFQNSIREEGLLAIATHGVIFAPGNGGTVQEIFQDACQNYYSPPAKRAPMILFGSAYWNSPVIVPNPTEDKSKPVYPLLLKLAQEKKFSHLLYLTDSIEQIIKFVSAPPSAT